MGQFSWSELPLSPSTLNGISAAQVVHVHGYPYTGTRTRTPHAYDHDSKLRAQSANRSALSDKRHERIVGGEFSVCIHASRRSRR